MNSKFNLYGRARRLAFYRNIAIIVGCIIAIVVILAIIFKESEKATIVGEYDSLKKYFVNRNYTCEVLTIDGSKCVSENGNVNKTFYRYDDGFEYIVKTDSYKLVMIHRLNKEDQLVFRTTSEAFEGYKNQEFICSFKNNVLDKVETCEAVKDYIILDIKSYLGIIEMSQEDVLSAISSSGFSVDKLLVNYEWIKK